MDPARTAVWITVAMIVGVALVSGPLVESVDFATEDPNRGRMVCDTSGSVDVEVQQVPTESFAISKQGYGAEAYALEADPLIVETANVMECPVVSYELRIPELGIFAFKNYYPTEDDEGPTSMEFAGVTIEPEQIKNDSYAALLTINVSGDQNRTVYRQEVTIPVEE